MGAVFHSRLSRRERQILEVPYRRRVASVAEMLDGLPDPPSCSAVRATVNILAARRAVKQLLATYLDNSSTQAGAALVRLHGKDLEAADIELPERMIRRRRKLEAAS